MTAFIVVTFLVVGYLALSFVVVDAERVRLLIRCGRAEARVAELEQQLADRSGVSA